jgi:hypothetical protein
MVAKVTPAIALVCVISGHSVDALVDVVGESKSGTNGTTTRAGLDRREKREINETGDIQLAWIHMGMR